MVRKVILLNFRVISTVQTMKRCAVLFPVIPIAFRDNDPHGINHQLWSIWEK